MRYTIEIHRDDGSKLYQQVGRFGEDLEVNFPDLVVEDDGTSFWGYTLKTKIGSSPSAPAHVLLDLVEKRTIGEEIDDSNHASTVAALDKTPDIVSATQ